MKPSRRRRLVARSAATALAVSLSVPALAAAAPTWTSERTFAPAVDPNDQSEFVVSPGGSMATAWEDSASVVRVTYDPVGPGSDTNSVQGALINTSGADVAINDAGDAVAVFSGQPAEGDNYIRVWAARRGAGDTGWSAPQVVSTENETGSDPDVAVDDDGNAVIVWNANYAGGPMKSAYLHADGTLEAVQEIRETGDTASTGYRPQVALDGAGVATVAYANQSIKVARRSAGAAGTYGEAAVVDTGSVYFVNQLWVQANEAGDAMVGWLHTTGSWASEVRTVHHDALGVGFTAPKVALDNDVWGFSSASVGMDGAGNAVALGYGQGSGETPEGTESAYFDELSGTWTPDTSVDQQLLPNEIRVDVAPDGSAVAAWYEGVNPGSVKMMRRTAGASGAWSAPVAVSDGTAYAVGRPRVGIDDEGSAAVLWMSQQDGPDDRFLKLRVDDQGPPAITEEAVPSSVEVGVPADLAVHFLDRYGDVTIDWDFGDGGIALDSSAEQEHTYETVGEADVAVVATDEVGRTTRYDEQINIVDTTAPTTSLDEAPSGTITTDPVLEFSGADNYDATDALTFECAVDGGTPAPCESPETFTGLDDGAHTITVAAVDSSGNVDATPESAAFTLDTTAPGVASFTRASDEVNGAEELVFYLSFSEDVEGFDAADLQLTAGEDITGATIKRVEQGPRDWAIVIGTGTGEGTIAIALGDDDSVTDAAGNPLGGAGVDNGIVYGPAYTIDKADPTVASIVRDDPSPTGEQTLRFSVRFSEAVTGVGPEDFELVPSEDIFDESITEVTGDSKTYSVTVDRGSGEGTLRLDVADGASIQDAGGNAVPAYSDGEEYTITEETIGVSGRGDVLKITGSDTDDDVRVGSTSEDGNTVRVVAGLGSPPLALADDNELCALQPNKSVVCALTDVPRVYADLHEGDDDFGAAGSDEQNFPVHGAVDVDGGPGTNTLVGGEGGDVLSGGPDADIILGLGGADLMDGSGGPDVIDADDTRSESGLAPFDDLARDVVICGGGADQATFGFNDVLAEPDGACENAMRTTRDVSLTSPAANATSANTAITVSGTGNQAVDTIVSVLNAAGQTVSTKTIASGADGAFSTQAAQPAGATPAGQYKVVVTQAGGNGVTRAAERTFTVTAPPTDEGEDPGDGGNEQPPAQEPAPVVQQPAGPGPSGGGGAQTLEPVTVRQALARTAQGIGRALRNVSIQTLLANPSTTVSFEAPGAGTVAVDYLAPVAKASAAKKKKKKKKAKALVVATGKETVSAAGRVGVRVKLTKAGRKALARAKRVTLTVRTSFTAAGASRAQTSTKKVTVKRKAKKAKRK